MYMYLKKINNINIFFYSNYLLNPIIIYNNMFKFNYNMKFLKGQTTNPQQQQQQQPQPQPQSNNFQLSMIDRIKYSKTGCKSCGS